MRIVLDPGHGGGDPGATTDLTRESKMALDIAKRAKGILEAFGRYEVHLTRDTDKFVSLQVSIHAPA